MSSPVLDLKIKYGLIRIIRAKYLPASHIEFAFYVPSWQYSIIKSYLIHGAGFKEEKKGKIVLRRRFFNIFIYKKWTFISESYVLIYGCRGGEPWHLSPHVLREVCCPPLKRKSFSPQPNPTPYN